GCIIRSALLETFWKAFQINPQLSNLLLDNNVAALLKPCEKNMREVVVVATQQGLPGAGLMAALSYFDNYRNRELPTNLIQAQRDYFGAHTYQRIDMPGTFHTEWKDSD
ncbi:MAG TPA: NADP-dependent phosphogluconate dehydrogenase, partial [Chitinophagales bacterium]|nr:NADP-dependent phosphogluconate dehydrogenase [Chitinophagales bacterium]